MAVETAEIIKELSLVTNKISDEKLNDCIKKINQAQRIFVYGTGRSGLMLKTFAMRLMQLGYISYVIGETITPSIHNGDLLIVASASGETSSVCQSALQAKKAGCMVMTITANRTSTLCDIEEPLIFIKSATKYSKSDITIQPLGSLFEQALLILFDAIILRVAKDKVNINTSMAKKHASIE